MTDDSVIQTAELLSALLLFHEAKKNLENLVVQRFPLGAKVEVQLDTTKANAVVAAYVAGFPDRVALLFENGNVWDKCVTKISLLPAIVDEN